MGLVKTALDDLTYKVNGLAMQVHSELKPGHREVMYQRRLAELLTTAGLQCEMEKRVEVYVSDSLIGYMFLDLWVDETLVIECKALAHQVDDSDIGQVLTYLAATGGAVAMLYNFGLRKLEYKRILPPKSMQEWHKHLCRFVWTLPGSTLPPISTITPETPIQFTVNSQHRAEPSRAIHIHEHHSSASPSYPSSAHASIRSISEPIPLSSGLNPTAPQDSIRLSVSRSNPLPDPAAPSDAIRLSVSRSNPLPDSATPTDAIRLSVSHSNPLPLTYSSSGVDITAGNRAVDLMRAAVRSTYGPEVVAGIGAFGGMFDARLLQTMQQPILVASTDGIGTKVHLGAQAHRYRSLGHDMVNHCIDDILVQGARPLFFLDYLASSKLVPEVMAEIVTGMSEACRAAHCVLIGGETAEMPGVYVPDAFDVAGTIVGVVERAAVLPRRDLAAGDLLVGLRSSGPHTNGYSLIRKIFAVPETVGPCPAPPEADQDRATSRPPASVLDTVLPELGIPLADALLAPHRSYLPVLETALADPARPIKALAHLTGGGFIENIPRVLPDHLAAVIRLGSWPVPPLFGLIATRGQVERDEMYRVFNMGIGMVVVVAPNRIDTLQALIGEDTYVIGELVPGTKLVVLQ